MFCCIRGSFIVVFFCLRSDSCDQVVGNNSALALAYELVQPFGTISSVGVHGERPFPLTGGQLYDKNVSFDFGRCPVRSLFPMAFDLLSEYLISSFGCQLITNIVRLW